MKLSKYITRKPSDLIFDTFFHLVVFTLCFSLSLSFLIVVLIFIYHVGEIRIHFGENSFAPTWWIVFITVCIPAIASQITGAMWGRLTMRHDWRKALRQIETPGEKVAAYIDAKNVMYADEDAVKMWKGEK